MAKVLGDYLYYEEKDPDLRIYHGDCLEIMPLLPRVDLVVTDPPYGIGWDSEYAKLGGKQYANAAAPKKYYESHGWDNVPISSAMLEMILSIGKHQVIFGGNYYPLPSARCWLIWDKQNGENKFGDCEIAWTNLDKPIRIKRHLWNGMLRKNGEERWGHPTQKPVEVLRWCIEQTEINGSVIDPFLGSGTTLVACKELNRNGIGIEINEKYCEIAKKRLRATCKPLFRDEPKPRKEDAELWTKQSEAQGREGADEKA